MNQAQSLKKKLKNPFNLIMIAISALMSVTVHSLLTLDANLDWDTYGRLGFIAHYDPTIGGDTHVLYHRTLWMLHGLGFSPVEAVFTLTSAMYGIFLLTVDWVARERGLRGIQRIAIWIVVIATSPGIWAMVWMAEDNVMYHAPVLAFFHLLTRQTGTKEQEFRTGCIAGFLLGFALLTNITVLIFFVIAPFAPLAFLAGRRAEALRAIVAVSVALLTYYGFHLFFGHGASLALHEYLEKAFALEDFGEDTAPTISLLRLEQFIFGCRAMFLIPTVYRMDLPGSLVTVVQTTGPLLVLGLYAVITLWLLSPPRRMPLKSWPVLTPVLWGVSLVFPYFYEPLLIERWDLFWMAHIFFMVAVVRGRPREGIEVLVVTLAFVQLGYSTLVATHHLSGAFLADVDAETVEITRELSTKEFQKVILPTEGDPTQCARITNFSEELQVFLVGESAGYSVECLEVKPWLDKIPVPCQVLGAAITTNQAYLHPEVRELAHRLAP